MRIAEVAALAADVLRSGRSLEIEVHGESMWPFVRGGDRVRVEPVVRPKLGNLAVVWDAGHLVVHRVVWIGEENCELRGDSGGKTLTVHLEDVLGVVTLQRTRDGRLVDHGGMRAKTVERLLTLHPQLSRCLLQALHRTRSRLGGRGMFLRRIFRTGCP